MDIVKVSHREALMNARKTSAYKFRVIDQCYGRGGIFSPHVADMSANIKRAFASFVREHPNMPSYRLFFETPSGIAASSLRNDEVGNDDASRAQHPDIPLNPRNPGSICKFDRDPVIRETSAVARPDSGAPKSDTWRSARRRDKSISLLSIRKFPAVDRSRHYERKNSGNKSREDSLTRRCL